jgi:hypothetical protein
MELRMKVRDDYGFEASGQALNDHQGRRLTPTVQYRPRIVDALQSVGGFEPIHTGTEKLLMKLSTFQVVFAAESGVP